MDTEIALVMAYFEKKKKTTRYAHTHTHTQRHGEAGIDEESEGHG